MTLIEILILYTLVSVPISRHWAGQQYREVETAWEKYNQKPVPSYRSRPANDSLQRGLVVFVMSFLFMWAVLPVFLLDKGIKAIPKTMIESTKNGGKQAAKHAFIGRAPKAEREEKTKAQLQARITELEKDLELENAI